MLCIIKRRPVRCRGNGIKEKAMGYAMAAKTKGGSDVIHRIEIGEITPAAGEVVIEHQAIGIT